MKKILLVVLLASVAIFNAVAQAGQSETQILGEWVIQSLYQVQTGVNINIVTGVRGKFIFNEGNKAVLVNLDTGETSPMSWSFLPSTGRFILNGSGYKLWGYLSLVDNVMVITALQNDTEVFVVILKKTQ